ncbi:STAS domain-containing protein [Desulfovibrio sp. OttesenSCG-928-A18]|nr:STAS domain-containing protein [Desulfovibrio sp. OttesenSCG-928-A18]
MKDFVDSCLLGALAETMLTRMPAEDTPPGEKAPRFACRPLAARSSERCTALGRFRGQIGLARTEEFKSALDDLVMENSSKIILDFAELGLTRSGVGVLVGFAASVQGRNKRLYIYRCSAQIREQLRELGLGGFFSFLESEDDVIATLVV